MLVQTGHVQIHNIDASSPHTIRVDFNPPYKRNPHIQLGIIALDVAPDNELRINSNVEEIHPDHCILRFNTWASSNITWGRISWMAIGTAIHELSDEDRDELVPGTDVVEHPK
ncbi:MAG: H-type lectin domain-containing protein [Gammaproteobacteria bacterium]